MGLIGIIWALVIALKFFTDIVTIGWFFVLFWPLFFVMGILVFWLIFVVIIGGIFNRLTR